MKKAILILSVILNILHARAPEFRDFTYITAGANENVQGTGAFQNGAYTHSCIVDWDGDDKKDLIVGQFGPRLGNADTYEKTSGQAKIRFYKNTGTNKSPEFDSFTYLKADGNEILVGTGG